MWTYFEDIGNLGVVRDAPPELLAPGVWTDARNMRFQDNKIKRMAGTRNVFNNVANVEPYWLVSVVGPEGTAWVYPGLNEVGARIGTQQAKIHKEGGYTGGKQDKWNGGVLGGIVILNNGVDVPQFWRRIRPQTKLRDLTDWPENVRARVLRVFGNFLVALYLTVDGQKQPHKVRWSHPADPGTPPVSWDVTDATRDAGEFELNDEEAGVLVDAVPLGDALMLYKEYSTWDMALSGTSSIFNISKVFSSSGLLAQNCVQPFQGQDQTEWHFVATSEDLIVHNGQEATSIATKTLRRWLERTIDPQFYKNSFCVRNTQEQELWFCFPEAGEELASLAVVWNWVDSTISYKELDNVAYATSGIIDETFSTDWDDLVGDWNSQARTFNQVLRPPHSQKVIQAEPLRSQITVQEERDRFGMKEYDSWVERRGLGVAGMNRQGGISSNRDSRKLVTRQRITAEGAPFEVQVGAQDVPEGPLTWAEPQTFVPGTTEYLDWAVGGKLLAVRFQSRGRMPWEVKAHALDIHLTGEF